MSIQKFPLGTIKKARQYIQSTLTLSDETSLQTSEVEELPEPKSIDDLSGIFAFGGIPHEEMAPSLGTRSGWFISTVNPGAALLKLPGLHLKPHYRLISYLYRAQDDGLGLVWAVPEASSITAQLQKALEASNSLSEPPKPDGALQHFMEAVEGDRSPASFIIASMLRRELQEFGALGQHRNWSHHHIVDAVPDRYLWQWRTEQPKDLSPKVKVSNDQAIVEFFTCRITAPLMIFRHVDQYLAEHYQPNSLDKGIAIAQPSI